MSFLTSYVSTKARDLHTAGIQLIAKWDPESAGGAQIAEWDSQARDMAATAAKALTDASAMRKTADSIRENMQRYTRAAENLLSKGETAAAEQSADRALEFKSQLEVAEAEAVDAEAWAAETHDAAIKAQRLVAEGRSKIERVKRDQARAQREAEVASQRLAERQRIAGITRDVSGADAAIDAMSANTRKAREKATADRIRSDALGKISDDNKMIERALAEVDGVSTPKNLSDKLAALRG